MNFSRIETTLDNLTRRFLEERVGDHWEGELSSSALATATASVALTLAHRREAHARFEQLARRGVAWLIRAQNEDGGWGDTARSLSNISTTALCWAALALARQESVEARQAGRRAAEFMRCHAGGLDPDSLSSAIKKRYGKDHTFSVPILMVLAVANLLGDKANGWARVPQLPFELAAFPQHWYSRLNLAVVSYALPALIAIGQAGHVKRPNRNPITRRFRDAVRQRTLRKLEEIQPPNGGFLEATPLTSFVTIGLIVADQGGGAVIRKSLDFLERSVRPDGSWPIDTNLAVWLTTLGVNALASGPRLTDVLDSKERAAACTWLLQQQFRREHPYTGTAPGGWAWTHLPGGVPDADDTAGALIAVRNLSDATAETLAAAQQGVGWLLDLQNSDGGIPTFCRGWGALPFDRSSPDLTAHALRAWRAWRGDLAPEQRKRVDHATERAVRYLRKSQHSDGSWSPLWFGNEHAPDDANLTFGTARVLSALVNLPDELAPATEQAAERWLLFSQNTDGGWGGSAGVDSSIEETALAVSALASRRQQRLRNPSSDALQSIIRGVDWLMVATDEGRMQEPAPIGFYFARLWYFEKLYPLVFSLEALGRVVCLSQG